MGSIVESSKSALEAALRKHVDTLALEIGPRTPLRADGLARAASYIRADFQEAGLEGRPLSAAMALRCPGLEGTIRR
jgi:hypothetical protein